MRRAECVIGALGAVLWSAPLSAQQGSGTVRGRVTDEATRQPLSGVTVAVGSRAALSQADGRYVITGVPSGSDTLRMRLIGYAPAKRSVTVGGGDTVVVDVPLAPQAVSLSEIVVTGYGTQRAGDITGAVTQVSSAEFNTGRIITPQQLIQSKVAGVQLVDNNEPGGGVTLRVRGANSVTASSDPLYVIDGMPVGLANTNPPNVLDPSAGLSAGRDALNFLNPDDIESITVLKDASAAAIYGVNAASGVVIIKTKSGQQGSPRVEYSTSMSSSSVTRLPEMLNATQFRAAVTQYAPANLAQLANANTDWFSVVDRTGFGQQHDVVVSGAGQSNNYRLSVGYLNQDGIIKGSSTQRVSLGFNYEQRLLDDRMSVRTSLKGSRTLDQFLPGNVLGNAAQMGPTQPVYDDTTATGYYNWAVALQSADNPAQILALAQSHGTTYRSLGNVQADYRLPFLDRLKANLNLGYDLTTVDQQSFNSALQHDQLRNGTGGTFYSTTPNLVNTVLEAYLNYSAPLDVVPGTIDVVGGYGYSQSHGAYPSVTLTGLSTDLLTTNGIPSAKTVQNATDIEDSKLISFFGRLNYNLNDHWLAAVSLRRDGSSRFGPSNAWGNFPSVAVAWRISQEPFMRGLSALSDLKLRASWGKTGNQNFANYQQYSTYVVGDASSAVQFGNTFVSTIRPSAFDPNIKWEATSSYNVGVDFGVSNQRFTGAVDWYYKKTTDMIFRVPIAAGTNFSNVLTTNIGSMKNSGIEGSLNAELLRAAGTGVSWTANFTASHNTNRLLTINPFGGSTQQLLVGGIAGVGQTIQVLEPGQPVNSFLVYRQNYKNGKPVEGSYLDQNGDTIPQASLNVGNRRVYHDPAPKWILGHSSYLSYGKFDLSFTLRAWLGNYVYNNVASNSGYYQQLTRSSPYNLSTSVLKTGFVTNQQLSDIYVENGSFLRMDNLRLGYTFQYRGQPMHLFAAVQNVFTITGYSGVDPTAGLNGIDNNIYPRARTLTGGVTVRF
ncbi:MAG TPA: SusC/RagA family TonB-linked outer membrane protein [Gemmatimonadales bacterium]|jgi:iron complex outermembrane receptor protein